jgi:hypothetical protein
MSTYRAEHGVLVQSLGSDLAATADNEGKLWYNSASNVWKIVVATNGGYTVKTITTS